MVSLPGIPSQFQLNQHSKKLESNRPHYLVFLIDKKSLYLHHTSNKNGSIHLTFPDKRGYIHGYECIDGGVIVSFSNGTVAVISLGKKKRNFYALLSVLLF